MAYLCELCGLHEYNYINCKDLGCPFAPARIAIEHNYRLDNYLSEPSVVFGDRDLDDE
jgi:hypothetical protein